nr:RNA-directed DNA polymerase, eukaryota [Tanacetum cinerariifolium]
MCHDTLVCGWINELSIVDDAGVDGRPHVRKEDQRNYLAQRCQPSHTCYASSSIMAAAAKSGGLPKFAKNGQPGGTSLPNPEMIMPVSNRPSNVIGDCISPVQSAFIKGRYILDGPLILNEVLAEYRQYNKELLLFKVDFEKSFDSLRRDFLDAVIEKMGFGLKINVDKSNVLGVGVSPKEVAQMASIIGCEVSKFLFKYLGVPVGGNMSRCVNWNVIIQKFSTKLSSWKAQLLSVGGRLSHIKAVLGNLPTYFMSIYVMPVSIRSKLESMRSKFFRGVDLNENKTSWVNWERCLASKKKGGLCIGSIYGLNIEQANYLGFHFIFDYSAQRKRRSPRGGAELAQLDALNSSIGDMLLTDQCDSWQ